MPCSHEVRICLQVYALEIEQYMKDFAQPVFEKAGVDHKVKICCVLACGHCGQGILSTVHTARPSDDCQLKDCQAMWTTLWSVLCRCLLSWAPPTRGSSSWPSRARALTWHSWTQTRAATLVTTIRWLLDSSAQCMHVVHASIVVEAMLF